MKMRIIENSAKVLVQTMSYDTKTVEKAMADTMAAVIMSDEEEGNMDKKIKAFFAAMGIATALLVSVPASADNSDSKVQVSIDITWDSLEFTYTDGQWDPETHSYKGGGWSDSGGNFTLTNTGNVGVMADFSYKQAEGMDEIKGYFSSSELIVPISESKNCKLSLSGKPTEHFESKTTGTVTVNVYPHGWANVNGTKYYFRLGYKETGWVKDEDTGDWYYFDKDGNMVKGWFKDGGEEWYYADEDGKVLTGSNNGGEYDLSYPWDYGKLYTDWVKVDDDWYYIDRNGLIAKNTIIDGRYIGLDGRWDGYGETPNM